MAAPEKVVIGNAELWHGDCREVLPSFPTCLRVCSLITDPPYGVDLGSTKGSGGAHGLALEAYDGYEDTYENYVEQIVPALAREVFDVTATQFGIRPQVVHTPYHSPLGKRYYVMHRGEQAMREVAKKSWQEQSPMRYQKQLETIAQRIAENAHR